MTKYKLVDNIDWESLHGEVVRVEVAPSYVILVQRNGGFHIIARAMKPRHGKKVKPIVPSDGNADAYEAMKRAVDQQPVEEER